MSIRVLLVSFLMFISFQGMAQLFGPQQIITTQADGAWSVHAADLDGDGDPDVLSASYTDDKIAWYENQGGGVFGAQQTITTQADAATSIHTADLDGDGDQDVLSASQYDNKIAWYENQGGGVFGAQQIITTQANYPTSVHTADLDGDGDQDVLSASVNPDKIAWYENQGGGVFGVQQIITTQADVISVYTADLDGDGDQDVLSASSLDNKIAWYENQGGGLFGAQQIITTQADYAFSVHTADLDGDGDQDVLSASLYDDKIAWYENQGGGVFGAQQIITTQADGARSVYTADLDGDGDQDVLSASGVDDKIAWYENQGGGLFGAQQIITTQADFANSVYTADLDGDGDQDVLSASFDDDKIAWYENLSGEGCTDPLACNYDPAMWIDNGSCCFDCGCTTEGAENYSSTACFNDGSCGFQVLGTVFFDENENGIMDGDEYGLPFQQVSFLPDSLSLTTNDNGNFFVNASGSDQYTFVLAENPLFPYFTTPQSLTFDASEDNWNQDILFGLSNEFPAFAICIDLYPSGNGYPCDVLRNHNICFRNMGNVPIDGVVELEYDSLFQGHLAVTPIDSVNGNTVYMSFTHLLPGQMFFYDVYLHTPTVEHIGEILTSTARIYGYYENQQVAYGEKILTMEVTCAYDPNDKQVFPHGYSEAHYIPQDNYMEYLIRFQNTGNAPATDVIVRDTLDANLDISSFQLVANSHSVFTTVDPENREVEFYFQNIMLPDSVNNEPESHGLISFKIRPEADAPLLTELNNTAYIFFDNNPPIVTNTTWSTLYDCLLFNVDFIDDGALLTASEGDSYQWFFEGEEIAGATAQEYTATENGNYAVQVSSDFPCTDLTPSVYILVSGLQEIQGETISLFPNPMTSAAVLDLGSFEGPFTLEIYDLQGKLVRSEQLMSNNNQVTLKRNNLASGSYVLRLNSVEGMLDFPFIIR